jgi:hypothetical protein
MSRIAETPQGKKPEEARHLPAESELFSAPPRLFPKNGPKFKFQVFQIREASMA